jgi:uncharacterized protein YjcR
VRPTKYVLEKELASGHGWRILGKKYGVTDNTIKKWAKRYGIPIVNRPYKRKVPKDV